jgi:hypothetical protein
MLSDGCSGSRDSDFGSRFLVLAGQSLLRKTPDPDLREVIETAHAFRHQYLSSDCLDATFVSLVESPGFYYIHAKVVGDGAIAALRKDGKLEIWDVAFKPGKVPGGEGVAPAYLNYGMDQARCTNFLNMGHGKRVVTHTVDGTLVETSESRLLIGEPGKFEPFEEGWAYKLTFAVEDYRAVFGFSDGVSAFQRDTGTGREAVPQFEVIKHLTAIPNFTGEFVARRAKAFFNRHCRDNKWQNDDDVSVIGIHCEA